MDNRTAHPDSSGWEAGRRRFLKRGAAFGATLLGWPGGPSPARAQTLPPAPDEPWKLLGAPVRSYGERSRFEQTSREKFPRSKTDEVGATATPLDETLGIITPSALHYEVHRSGVPDIDPRQHRLLIHGMVDHPVMLTMEEIRRLPSVSRILFLECQGNSLTEWREPTAKSVQGTHGFTSCSEWTGVSLSLLLRQVGVQKGAAWVLAEGADGSGNERSIPLAKAMDDVLVAYGQNGEAARPENGYPLRLIVPGWTGNISVKWLRRIKVVDRPYLTRMDTVGQPVLLSDGKARQLRFVMEAKSVITSPAGGLRLAGPGFYEIRGLAWSGRGLVRRVEVSTDAGKTWREARLQQPVLPLAHTRFRFDWRWDGGEAILQSRCTDETGYVQPTLGELVRVRGQNSIYFNNAIQSWKVAADGSVHNVHA
ncbi:MAG TPA: sulfite dehydrogenase [Methylomirabilota bacterium]|nr:sulfite dehydrogenase [Methylomirabilota bacterium]